MDGSDLIIESLFVITDHPYVADPARISVVSRAGVGSFVRQSPLWCGQCTNGPYHILLAASAPPSRSYDPARSADQGRNGPEHSERALDAAGQ